VSPDTQPPAEDPPHAPRPGRFARGRGAFRDWRRTRPFWGALLITVGGAEILITEWAPFRVVLHIGLQGLAGYLLPAVMVLCGLLLWFSPAQRTFYSVLCVLLSLATWVTSNLGGFVVGMLLGLVGGSLAFGWTPRGEGGSVRTERPGARFGRLHRSRPTLPASDPGTNTPML
jgi:hypothetical protein